MIRKLVLSLLFFSIAAGVFAQETLKTLSLSSDFSSVAGTPRVVRNGFKHIWVTVWRQQGAPSKLLSKIIQSDGTAGATKTLVTGVNAFEGAFDIAYDSVNYTYLVAFETVKGLQVQFYNPTFVKVGPPVLIEAGAVNTTPRLAFNFTDKHFVIVYVSSQDGVQRRILRSRDLDAQGKPLSNSLDLATAAAGKVFGFLSLSTNPQNGNMIAMIMHNAATTAPNGELLGYALKKDGSKLKSAPLKFQPPTPGLSTFADTGFADDGTGFALWADRTAIKFRKINATMGFAGATKSITAGADPDSIATSVTFDSRNKQYLAVWTRSNQVVSSALNTVTGAIVKPTFGVADSAFTHSRNAATSYDPSQGNAIVVWEDSTAAANTPSSSTVKFRIRAALFFVAGTTAGSTISVGDNFFSPNNLHVDGGTTVTWVFNGNNPHTVTSSNGSPLSSGTQQRGATFSFRFTAPGTYNYFCTVHGQSMSGTIVVDQPDGEPPPHY